MFHDDVNYQSSEEVPNTFGNLIPRSMVGNDLRPLDNWKTYDEPWDFLVFPQHLEKKPCPAVTSRKKWDELYLVERKLAMVIEMQYHRNV